MSDWKAVFASPKHLNDCALGRQRHAGAPDRETPQYLLLGYAGVLSSLYPSRQLSRCVRFPDSRYYGSFADLINFAQKILLAHEFPVYGGPFALLFICSSQFVAAQTLQAKLGYDAAARCVRHEGECREY